MLRTCLNCGKEFETKRSDAKFDTANCRVTYGRKQQKGFDSKPVEEKLSAIEEKLGFKIDRTRAFTEEEMEKVRKLPRFEWIWAMHRPDSWETMSETERLKHYQSQNYPETRYQGKSWGV